MSAIKTAAASPAVTTNQLNTYYQAVTVATYPDALAQATGTQKKRITVTTDTVNNSGETSLYDWDGTNLLWIAAQKVN